MIFPSMSRGGFDFCENYVTLDGRGRKENFFQYVTDMNLSVNFQFRKRRNVLFLCVWFVSKWYFRVFIDIFRRKIKWYFFQGQGLIVSRIFNGTKKRIHFFFLLLTVNSESSWNFIEKTNKFLGETLHLSKLAPTELLFVSFTS